MVSVAETMALKWGAAAPPVPGSGYPRPGNLRQSADVRCSRSQ